METGLVTTIGGTAPLTVRSEGITFGRARVIETDIRASNGIIHVLYDVNLTPSS